MAEYNRDQVKNIIASVIDKADATQAQSLSHVRSELQKLADIIDALYDDVLATRSHDVGDKHIPSATDELDAVIGATEEASASIMDACEVIQSEAAELSDEEKKKVINDQTGKIFEACSFQDITGQRITKVVKTLRQIEESVDNLLNIFGPVDAKDRPEKPDMRTEDEKLMEGPQLAGQGVSQDEIDKLLAEFD
jgi:chemotaxis protein CheZ